MEPLGHGAIRFRHLGDLREYVASPVRLTRASAPPLVEGLLHRGSFLGRQQLGRIAGAADRRLRALLWAHVVSPPGCVIQTIMGSDSMVLASYHGSGFMDIRDLVRLRKAKDRMDREFDQPLDVP